MNLRYPVRLARTSLLAATLLGPAPSPPPPPLCAPLSALYSPRALRRLRIALATHFLRLREAELPEIRSVVLRKSSPDALLGGANPAQIFAQEIRAAELKHSATSRNSITRNTSCFPDM